MGSNYHITQAEIRGHPLYRARTRQDALSLYEYAGWDYKHLNALHVLLFTGLPMERICPTNFEVSSTSELGENVKRAFSITEDDIKAGRYPVADFTSWFYSELALLLRTGQKTPSPVVRDVQPRVREPFIYDSPEDKDPNTFLAMSFSDSSQGSSYSPSRSPVRVVNEGPIDVREIVTNNMVVAFLSTLSNMAYPERNPTQHRPEFNARPDAIKFILNGSQISSENDGSGWRMRFSQTGNQRVPTGGAPLMTIKVKRNRHKLHDDEILAQEVGELLVVVKLKQSKKGFSKEINREGYLVSAHHTSMYISTVMLSESYMHGVDAQRVAKDDWFIVRRSKEWDLSIPGERMEAAMAFLSCLNYTMNADA